MYAFQAKLELVSWCLQETLSNATKRASLREGQLLTSQNGFELFMSQKGDFYGPIFGDFLDYTIRIYTHTFYEVSGQVVNGSDLKSMMHGLAWINIHHVDHKQ